MKYLATLAAAGASLIAISSASAAENPVQTQADAPEAQAEQADQGAEAEGEIIVTARRKNESLQDVPLTVNAVNAEELANLNIRRFEDIQTVVPGLTLGNNANGIGAVASVRGVAFDVNASGNNGTVEFYLNDSPISAGNLFQAMFDIGQVELLRGPQGTLRGRASPSGSMTVTTHKADLSGWGGYINATGTSIGGINANAAVNVPIIRDMLAIRVAAIVDQNEGSRVTSVNNPLEPYSRTRGARASIRFDPTENITITAMYQKLIQNVRSFQQVESQSLVTGGAASPVTIRASDRLAVADGPRYVRQEFDNLNLQAQWSFGGQVLNYAGAMNKQHFLSGGPTDEGDFFGPAFGGATRYGTGSYALRSATPYPDVIGWGQFTNSHAKAWAHELRLSSEERLFGGLLDYTVGVFQQKLSAPTDLVTPTLFFLGAPTPATTNTVILPPPASAASPTTPRFISRRGGNKEQSAFGSLTLHLGESTELAGGLRYIRYRSNGTLGTGTLTAAGGYPDPDTLPLIALATENVKFNAVIYSASAKHEFSDNFMVYANVGSSWRPGISATGDFSLARSALEQSFVVLPPEKSTSYELGFKASALDKRLRLNVSAFHQDFKNYPYRSPSGVFFAETVALGNPPAVPPTVRVNTFNFVAAVPVKVNGAEAELSFAATPDWDISLNASYAKGKIKNGQIPCNDYFRRNADGSFTAGISDGIPDAAGLVPTLGNIQSATNGGTISACNVTQRSSLAPLWTVTGQTEYRAQITDSVSGFARGLVTVYGDSQNDPTNFVDDVKAYALANVYAGIRDPDGAWEVSLYAKNVTNTGRVLSRSSNTLTTPYSLVVNHPVFGQVAAPQTGVTTYYGVTYTNPREFGLNVRFAFGTR